MAAETSVKAPQVGDKYHCAECGMEIEVIMPCQSSNTASQKGPEFRCCGAELTPGGAARGETLTPEAARGDFTA